MVISLYNLVLVGNLLTNGTSELPYFTRPQPASAFVIYPICSVEIWVGGGSVDVAGCGGGGGGWCGGGGGGGVLEGVRGVGG